MERFDAVLFDCDGVLVDSEPITNGVLRQMLNEAGWALTPAECEHHFIGRAVRDQRALIEAETGKPLVCATTSLWVLRHFCCGGHGGGACCGLSEYGLQRLSLHPQQPVFCRTSVSALTPWTPPAIASCTSGRSRTRPCPRGRSTR